ncbi:undecaprenol kinase [Geomicrobium halophilum]|uniref:Undecaprenol kinase n=1 Tax=Geomicrobium halophilum TaxID=549000 RepID=A0A841PNQ7_9BACL|nr:undecaprenol kinase [Geomicrobium halophilum]
MVKYEQNMAIHMFITIVVFILGFIVGLTPVKWAILLMIIGGVIALEMVNTAIERVVDMVSADYHPLAKVAKDVAASAVLIYSMIAVIVGILIFYEPIMTIFGFLTRG